MNIQSVNSDLIRGNVTTIILGSLWSSDRYGYDILKEIETKSEGQYKIKQATLYNQLKKLEEQGLISSYDGDPDDTGGGKRKYFALTAEGRSFLKKEKNEYEYARTILDKLVSSQEFDFNAPLPFEASELRPYSKKNEDAKPKVVYKDKIVEKLVYLDRFGNEITKEDAEILANRAEQEDREKIAADEKIRQTIEENEREIAVLKDKLQEQESINEQNVHEKEEILIKIKELEEINNKINSEKEKQSLLISEKDELNKQTESEKQEALNKLKAIEDEQKRIEAEKAKIAEEERLKAEEEARIKQEEQAKPSFTIQEMFEKLDLESEYNKHMEDHPLPEKYVYVNGYTGELESSGRSQTSLRDALMKLDEKEAAIDKQKEVSSSPIHADEDVFATSATIQHPESQFAYEKEDINYREFFYSIKDTDESITNEQEEQSYSTQDIKTRLYSKGYKIRPYDRGNTSEYYTFNFLHSNRILKDTFLFILGLFAVEVGIMWSSLATKISYVYFLPILLVGSFLCIIPTFIYLANPTKRTRAKFNFKFSILNTTMFWIELTVVCILIGFFGVGASIDDINVILCSIVLPMVLLTNIPVSSLVYWLLYRSRKYHTA